MKKAPNLNEFEISIFGPGYGECILIHLGNNEWIVIDSCFNPDTKESVVFSYLKSLKLVPKEVIKLIIISHWDDDHIKGLCKIVEECEYSDVCISNAIHNKHFYSLVKLYDKKEFMSSRLTSGLKEISRILKILENRIIQNNVYPLLAMENRTLMESSTNSKKKVNIKFKVISLTPSDKSVYESTRQLGKSIPTNLSSVIRVSPISPNHYSVVLQIIFNKLSILLGADLEQTSDSETGWKKVLSSYNSVLKSLIFKIPHHGSKSSHNDAIWNNLLEPSPISLLTPFSKGRNQLPTKDDISRILDVTSKAFITKSPKWAKNISRNKTVDKTIKEASILIKTYDLNPGHISLRYKLDSKDRPRISFGNDACSLKSLLN